jgi:hypothetical protein
LTFSGVRRLPALPFAGGAAASCRNRNKPGMTQMTEAEIAELADGWTKEDMAEWGIPSPPPKDLQRRLLSGEHKRRGDDASDSTVPG